MSQEIVVLHEGNKYIYIHNDLQTAAYYFKDLIANKLKNDARSGIAYDKMACMMMLAFAVEASINFFGFKLIKDWNERQSYDNKMKQVLGHLKVAETTRRPFSSIKNLKEFRDMIAHGKPKEVTFRETLIMTPEEADRANDLSGEWERFCGDEAVIQVYEDFEAFWKILREASGLDIYETLTRGDRSISAQRPSVK